MNPYTGELFESVEAAKAAGVKDPVEVTGSPDAVQAVSDAVRAEYRRRAAEGGPETGPEVEEGEPVSEPKTVKAELTLRLDALRHLDLVQPDPAPPAPWLGHTPRPA